VLASGSLTVASGPPSAKFSSRLKTPVTPLVMSYEPKQENYLHMNNTGTNSILFAFEKAEKPNPTVFG